MNPEKGITGSKKY